MDCGCLYQYSPDVFTGGERRFKCRHNKTWSIRAIRAETTYETREVTEEVDDDG